MTDEQRQEAELPRLSDHCGDWQTDPRIDTIPNGLIAGEDLYTLIECGVIDALPEHVNAASIDVRLGEMFVEEWCGDGSSEVDLVNKRCIDMRIVSGLDYKLRAGQFCLAQTIEIFNLPDCISAQFKLRSSLARSGLNHLLAGWCDAGWHNSVLTLELQNVTRYHTLILTPGMRIGQMVFWKHKPAGKNSYAVKGRYNHTTSVTESKGA